MGRGTPHIITSIESIEREKCASIRVLLVAVVARATCAYAANGTGWDVERVDAWYDKTDNSGRPGNFNKTLAGQRKHILAEGFLMLLVPLLRRRWALALLRRRPLWC